MIIKKNTQKNKEKKTVKLAIGSVMFIQILIWKHIPCNNNYNQFH